MLEFRVTKYDPRFRSPSGAFLAEDWTAMCDIGKAFAGEVLTEARYLAVEGAYIRTALSFLKEANVAALTATGVENRRHNSGCPQEGARISNDQAATVLRGLLREEFWCRLEGDSSFIHVGYDYYMYIGVGFRCPLSEDLAGQLGLFVEEFESPYAHDAA